MAVFISYSCYNKVPQLSGLENRNLLSHSVGSLRSGCQHGQVLMKSSGLQTCDFLLNLHVAKRQREEANSWLSLSFFFFKEGKSWLFFFKDFLMWTIFKVFIQFVTILLIFMLWFYGHKACGILAAWSGSKPLPPVLEGKVLTTGPPGKSLFSWLLNWH